MVLVVRRDRRVQWNRIRRCWLSRLRKLKAMRAASLISRLVPSVPVLVIRVSRQSKILGHQASTVSASLLASGRSAARTVSWKRCSRAAMVGRSVAAGSIRSRSLTAQAAPILSVGTSVAKIEVSWPGVRGGSRSPAPTSSRRLVQAGSVELFAGDLLADLSPCRWRAGPGGTGRLRRERAAACARPLSGRRRTGRSPQPARWSSRSCREHRARPRLPRMCGRRSGQTVRAGRRGQQSSSRTAPAGATARSGLGPSRAGPGGSVDPQHDGCGRLGQQSVGVRRTPHARSASSAVTAATERPRPVICTFGGSSAIDSVNAVRGQPDFWHRYCAWCQPTIRGA